ncbi:two-component system response regulator QseB [Deinococcus metalli]|uniref:Two-component system response regulator QseB n=2 Tax=Deinococcus metalli TaxID=1141878 RepID=A0A7W8NQ61_9DEIO|nr:response regulator transcription factor [Deinococcus metalli]MBB5378694.1 two-component system response regulator QseB [Deinococcus metalli]
MRILLVEDEEAIAMPLRRALESQGHEVRHAGTLEAGRASFVDTEPDLALLDVRLPDDASGGFTLAREVRAAGYRGPLLFLTARDTSGDRVEGLDLGGDDYLVKPFDLPELLARVRALLRRASDLRSDRVTVGALELDFSRQTVCWAGQPVSLSGREYALLERLARSPGRLYPSTELFDLVWDGQASDPGAVKVCVHHLRSKLGPEVIRTDARGYCLGTGALT